jgi:ABC-type lipoprotein export system ATPase subunit
VLEDALNSALGQIVSYELKMDLIETKAGSLELVTRVVDELGEREVKSLSGGQKVMLKLARILTIAAYLKVPCLLLDETINNLDQQAVGQISQLLESFVKKQRMKLYVVTHSSQIQDLSIWDETIALEREKDKEE